MEEAAVEDIRALFEEDGSSTTPPSPIDCAICFNRLEGERVAAPASCEHRFCVGCLRRWMELSNTCPLDRKRFQLIEIWAEDGSLEGTLSAPRRDQTWDEHLPYITMAYNSSVHSTTGFTPHRLLYGREMTLPIQVLTGGPPEDGEDGEDGRDNHESYDDMLRHRLKETHDIARETTKQQVKTQKEQYDRGCSVRKLEPGQPVWLYWPHRKKGQCPKLTCKWKRGYVVTHKLDDVLYRVQKGRKGKGQVVHIQRLLPYEGRDPPKWWKPQPHRATQ